MMVCALQVPPAKSPDWVFNLPNVFDTTSLSIKSPKSHLVKVVGVDVV